MTDTSNAMKWLLGCGAVLAVAVPTFGMGQYVAGLRNDMDNSNREVSGLKGQIAQLQSIISQMTTEMTGLRSSSASVPGPKGDKGEAAQPELRATSAFIQWRVAGDPQWTDLVALDALRGPPGNDGASGPAGTTGPAGEPGRAVELRSVGNALQWRREGDESWITLAEMPSVAAASQPTTAQPLSSPQTAPTSDVMFSGRHTVPNKSTVFVGPDEIPLALLGSTQNGKRFMANGSDWRPSPGLSTVIGGSCSVTYLGEAPNKDDALINVVCQ